MKDYKDLNIQDLKELLVLEALKKLSIDQRINYILILLAKIPSTEENKIDWGKISEIVMADYHHYNNFDNLKEVKSIYDLCFIKELYINASVGLLPFYKGKCKICGSEFFLSLEEVKFYDKKKFPLPKRCKK